ncbi:MAG: type II secretion system F family protein [Acidimicrobiia bacterium]|nr:type II secretion system F family protein [Acidimicrobiia bacterium]
MTAAATALVAASGTYLLVTSALFGWRGRAPRLGHTSLVQERLRRWAAGVGIQRSTAPTVLLVMGGTALAGAGLATVLFGGLVPAVVAGAFGAAMPLAAYRRQQRARRDAVRASWPALLDEVRVRTGAGGQSIPQALIALRDQAPPVLAPTFAAAHHRWSVTTDLDATLAVVRDDLADAATDTICETLLAVHEAGGPHLHERLETLAEDRRVDLRHRKDALARQAGARFARRFVVLVPVGMALVGMSIGSGRAAYATPAGQLVVGLSIALVAVCWWWAGRLMAVPEPPRVHRR